MHTPQVHALDWRHYYQCLILGWCEGEVSVEVCVCVCVCVCWGGGGGQVTTNEASKKAVGLGMGCAWSPSSPCRIPRWIDYHA